MPSAKDLHVRRPSRFIWTPDGLVDLAEPFDFREFKPIFLGVFKSYDGEGPTTDVVPDRARCAPEDFRRLLNVHEHFPISSDSSHDSDPMLG